ncbi:MAG: hypothetical protein KAX49_03585 [Halanaerobiales bacterium]|nr:hypothetical protein [Halanaerobiales bacterium]
MKILKSWFPLIIFLILVVFFINYQELRKKELITYLSSVDQCFSELELIQELSFEADQAGIQGDYDKELELNSKLISLSENSQLHIKNISFKSRYITRLQKELIELNNNTHLVLLNRNQLLNQIKNDSLTIEEKEKAMDNYWSLNEKNEILIQKFTVDLHRYIEKFSINPEEYLKHLP